MIVHHTISSFKSTITQTVYSPLASSIFAPAVANAAEEFNETSTTVRSLGVTAYLFGYGVSTTDILPGISRKLTSQ